MTGGNIIDQFWIALGVKPDPAGLNAVKKQVDEAKESLLSAGNALKAFVAGLAIRGIAKIGSDFEQNTIAIAGFLEALNLSPDGSGLKDAEATMKSITTAAAKLPGEAEEYVEVFRAGLPVLKGAMPGGSIQAMTDFTNRFTAIGKTLQVDAGQIGRDLGLLLGPTGRAGATVLTFQRMLPFIRQLKGHANETAESFNRMTQPQRLQLLQDALANPALSKMLDRSAESFDAMYGSVVSMVKQLVRLSTVGIFKGMKEGLAELSALFVDNEGNLTETGESFAEMGRTVGKTVVTMSRMLGSFLSWLVKNKTALTVLKGALSVVGVALAGAGFAKAVEMVAKLSAGVLNLTGLLRGGLFAAVAAIAEDLYVFYTGGESVTGLLVEKFGPAVEIATGLVAGIGAAFLVATSPISGMTAAIAALIAEITLLVNKWEEVKATVKFLPKLAGAKIADAIAGTERGAPSRADMVRAEFGRALTDIEYQKSGRLAPGAAGPAFQGQAPMATAPAAPVWEKWDPSMGGTTSNPGGSVVNNQSSSSVTIQKVEIKTPNPREAGNALMNVTRNAQSRVSH